MNRNTLEQLFSKRFPVYDHPVGMQIFKTAITGSYFEAEEHHANEVIRSLFFSLPMEMLEPSPTRTMAGLIFLTANESKLPRRWHVEYLADRWFMRVGANLLPHAPLDAPPAFLVTECRIVVDEWGEIPGRSGIKEKENHFRL